MHFNLCDQSAYTKSPVWIFVIVAMACLHAFGAIRSGLQVPMAILFHIFFHGAVADDDWNDNAFYSHLSTSARSRTSNVRPFEWCSCDWSTCVSSTIWLYSSKDFYVRLSHSSFRSLFFLSFFLSDPRSLRCHFIKQPLGITEKNNIVMNRYLPFFRSEKTSKILTPTKMVWCQSNVQKRRKRRIESNLVVNVNLNTLIVAHKHTRRT